ncbi:MAG TPA: hypothetical protein VOA87_13350 [Thermoanaerobaculia bacterium]|nr:hypothetical protein [Thermoanaerobaculia bacterium]
MKSTLRRLRRGLWEPGASPVTFFVGAFLFAISANLVSSRLQEHSTLASGFVFGIVGLILVVLVSRRWLADDIRPTVDYGAPRKHKWLVALASPGGGIATAEKAIRYHLPVLQKVYLVCSRGKEPPLSEPAAKDLIKKLEQEGLLAQGQIELIPLSATAFDDPEAVRSAIEALYDLLPEGIAEHEVVIDITGGKKTTTAGAFLAGLPRGRHLEYVPATRVSSEGRGEEPGDPIEIVIDYKLKKLGH